MLQMDGPTHGAEMLRAVLICAAQVVSRVVKRGVLDRRADSNRVSWRGAVWAGWWRVEGVGKKES